MPWSMPLAEVVGTIAGITAGELCSEVAKNLAKDANIPEIVGKVGGAVVGHYVSAAATKAIINMALCDVPGLAANVTVTSPTTSLVHGVFKAIDADIYQIINQI